MFSWKVLWSTVLIFTVAPADDSYPLRTDSIAFFGTSSE